MRLLALVAVTTVVTALPEMFMGRPRDEFNSRLHKYNVIDPSNFYTNGESSFTQKLDHFDSTNAKTWEQRFFFNHEYATSETTVNLLYLSGEMAAIVYYAKKLEANLFSLEHRFFGESRPTKDTSVGNLKYLSSRQAIEDIAEFIRYINTQKGGDQRWIVVGGSYAGSLSAWSRLLHPELIAGSLASSAPLLAQEDFYGYLETVDANFNKSGAACYDQINAGLESALRLLQTEEGRLTITDIFKIDPPLNSYDSLTTFDIDVFFSYLISPFEMASQYGSPPVDRLCETFTSKGPDYDPLEAFALIIGEKVTSNFDETVEELSEIEYDGNYTSTRLWTYLACNEFGFIQSTNLGTNAFGQTQSSSRYIEYCAQLFGIDADQIQKNVDSTNEYYGERDYFAGTNVIFSHGTQDPWSFLTKKNGLHCQDIHLSCFNPILLCTDNVKQIQTLTLENMQRWVDPIFPVPDRVEITDNVGKRPQFFDPKVSPSLQTNVMNPDFRQPRSKRPDETPTKVGFNIWNKFRRMNAPPVSENIQLSDSLKQGWIEQTWDHFNLNEERTFKQKWYSDYKFGSQEGPNFLMIGGESPMDTYWIADDNQAWMTYAKEVGANVFNLEHRYYGKSKLGTNDPQYLSSDQALYDVATFIRSVQVHQNRSGPWITFGGSYPGSLAAWSREWFPELILGAVASSAPMLIKNDIYEYFEAIEDAIRRYSQKCYDRTAEAFDTLYKLTQNPEGRAVIQEKFLLIPAWSGDSNFTVDPLDLNQLFSVLSAMYVGSTQNDGPDNAEVITLCNHFENDSISSIDALSLTRMDLYGEGIPLIVNFDFEIQFSRSVADHFDGHDDKFSDDGLAATLFLWQMCNEFGWSQTTDYGKGIFGGGHVPLNSFMITCERVFGVGMDHVEKGVARANYLYGGRKRYNTTNVVFPNGDVDPWHAMGLLERGNLDESIVPILIKGTAHCADMYVPTPSDPLELIQARKTILENIKKWLAPTLSSITSTYPSSTTTLSTKRTTPPTTELTQKTVMSTGTTTKIVKTTQTTTTASPTTSVAFSASFLVSIILTVLISLS